MRKVTYKVTLEVTAVVDEGADGGRRLQESGFIIDPDEDTTDDVMDIHDIKCVDVEYTDSR